MAVGDGLLETAADGIAIHLGHHHVEQDYVRRQFRHALQRLHAACGLDHVDVLGLKLDAEDLATRWLVVDDEHAL